MITKELSRSNLALLCCLGRIRTLTGGTRIRRATITPQGKVVCFEACFRAAARGVAGVKFLRFYRPLRLTSAKLCVIFELTKFSGVFLRKILFLWSEGAFQAPDLCIGHIMAKFARKSSLSTAGGCCITRFALKMQGHRFAMFD